MSSLLGKLLSSRTNTLNQEQQTALENMGGDSNFFLTGRAGSGKSFLLKEFLRGVDDRSFPVLASTGAAAVLIGGRTFHSFFGLGILEGGPEATIERALKDRRLAKRLKKIKGFVLDEISMIPGQVLETAERIASLVRGDLSPWGGLQVIAVGDFAQLPPVNKGFGRAAERDWAFLNSVWGKSNFQTLHLNEMMRSGTDQEFCDVLNDVRLGVVSEKVKNLLDWKTRHLEDDDFEGTVLFSRKVDVERINQSKLALIKSPSKTFSTEYSGADRFILTLKKQAPIVEQLELKKGALVMCRQNDAKGRYVNGSLGHVDTMDCDGIGVRLLGGNYVEIEKAKFTMMDAEGNEVAVAKNFPLSLAYALTIHKAQGATLDRATVSLKQLWEPGQAYVALSRLKNSDGLVVDSWDKESIFADATVVKFHESILLRESAGDVSPG